MTYSQVLAIFSVVMMCTLAAALPVKRAETEVSWPLWCESEVDINIPSVKEDIRTTYLRFVTYRGYLISGHPNDNSSMGHGYKIPDLFPEGDDKCGLLLLPKYLTMDSNNILQIISNHSANIQLLSAMYRKVLMLIKVHHNSISSQKNLTVSKLTTMQVLMDHLAEQLDIYLSAEQCSCEAVDCEVHELTTSAVKAAMNEVKTKSRIAGCTMMNLLHKIMSGIKKEAEHIDNLLKKDTKLTNWKLCQIGNTISSMCSA